MLDADGDPQHTNLYLKHEENGPKPSQCSRRAFGPNSHSSMINSIMAVSQSPPSQHYDMVYFMSVW